MTLKLTNKDGEVIELTDKMYITFEYNVIPKLGEPMIFAEIASDMRTIVSFPWRNFGPDDLASISINDVVVVSADATTKIIPVIFMSREPDMIKGEDTPEDIFMHMEFYVG